MSKRRSRANGEGSIYKDKNGVWWAQRYLPGGGYLRRRSTSHAGAVAKMNELQKLACKPKREPRDEVKQTVAGFAAQWLSDIEGGLQPRTIETYRWALANHIEPLIGNRRIAEIEYRDVQDMADRIGRKQGVGRATVGACIRVLHSLLEEATRRAARPPYVNPAKGIRLPKQKADTAPKHLTETELVALVGATQSIPAPFRQALLFVVFTGTRNAEMRGVRWQDITDSKHGPVVRIGGQVEKVRTGEYRQTRSGSAREVIELRYKAKTKTKRVRFVTLEPIVVEALAELRAMQEAAGVLEADGFVFLQPPRFNKSNHDLLSKWRPVTDTPLRSHLLACCSTAGCPYRAVHGLRHTFVTLTLAEGDNAHATQKTVGHSHASTTSDIYAGQTIRSAKIATSAMTEIIERGKRESG